MMGTVCSFGVTQSGQRVDEVVLKNGRMSCGILTYGAALRFLSVPNRAGGSTDVVLGFSSLEDYVRQEKYMGAIIGRCANRLGGSAFTLDGTVYSLTANDGPNHLHGGPAGFDKQVWTLDSVKESEAVLSLRSPAGQEGYPGTLSVEVTYRLEQAALRITYAARTDAPTLCNLTNHSYFNLAGHQTGTVLSQEILLHADAYTPADAASLPVGTLADVAGTPMDLRHFTPIATHIEDDFPQIHMATGYDHNWVIRGAPGTLRPAAQARCHESGIAMEVLTTMPGLQFYTGNDLHGCPPGKDGAFYGGRSGFCLETQYFPNSMACPAFSKPILRPGEAYAQTTVFQFSLF